MVRALDGLFGDSECTQAVHELYAYLDHALPHQQWEQLEAHLSRCAPCVRAFAFEARLRVVIAQRCTESVPPALVRRVVVAVRREAGRH
jgi:mycothiol system anti-sigma-R factor